MKPPENHDVIELLRELGFRIDDDSLRALLKEWTKTRASPLVTVEQLARAERSEREQRNLARRAKFATLGTFKTLDRFDWSWPRSVDQELYERLKSLDFLAHGHNVLLRGQSGTGKTTLAQNLGLYALQGGYSVRFTTLAQLIADLLVQESVPALERRMRRYTNPDMLIIDEIGYLPSDTRSADLLYNVISRRHERASTVITTNLAFKKWGDVFPGAACVAALVDRFVQHCHVVDIDADSWRRKEADEPGPRPPTPPRQRRARTAR